MEADTLVETLADTLAEAEYVTFGDTIGDLNARALVNTVGDTLAWTHTKANSTWEKTGRCGG